MITAAAARLGGVAAAYGGVVRSHAYFSLWQGQLVSNFGDTLHYIALVVLVFQLTGQRLAAAGLAAGATFFNPTVQAVIPVLTTEEQRLAANSVSWSTGRLVQILAAAVAGGLIAVLGTRAAFGLDAASFLRAIASLIPPGQTQVRAGVNAHQTLLAKRSDGRWQIVVFQNTPASFHRRPERVQEMTRDLQAVADASG